MLKKRKLDDMLFEKDKKNTREGGGGGGGGGSGNQQAAAWAKRNCEAKQMEAWNDNGEKWNLSKITHSSWTERMKQIDTSCTKWQPTALNLTRDSNEWPQTVDAQSQYHTHRTFFYRIEKDKRADCKIVDGTSVSSHAHHSAHHSSAQLIRELKLVLPEFLNEQLWQRHQYSLDDIRSTLKHSPTMCIWQMCLYHNIPLLQSASKISSTTSLIRGGKRNAIRSLMTTYSRKYADWKHRPSVLLHLPLHGNRQRIPLPCHKMTATGIKLLQRLLPERDETHQWLGQPLRRYQSCVKWLDGFFVPLAFYAKSQQRPVNMIFLIRILPKPLYESVFSVSNETLMHQPDMILLRDVFCCLLDEAFFVWTNEDV